MPKREYFDREGDISKDIDRQAGYHDFTAATIYNQLINEAPGQIRPFRERYRKISLFWHWFWLAAEAGRPPKRPANKDLRPHGGAKHRRVSEGTPPPSAAPKDDLSPDNITAGGPLKAGALSE